MNENFYGATDPGRIRTNNEDVFLAMELQNGMIAAAAIDGVGGYEGGEIAAATARDAIAEILAQHFNEKEAALKECLHLANKRIFEARPKHPQATDMACVLTLALADIPNNEFHFAHVGDTRLYLLRAHNLMKQTRDQSFVGYLEDSGRIGEMEAMRHPKRNEINKALGFDPYVHQKADYIDTGSSPFLPGDLLLLCSDGLTDMINSQEIVAILTGDGSLREKTDALIAAANNAGGKDNITVVLVQNNRQRSTHEATKPVQKAEEKLLKPDQKPKSAGKKEPVTIRPSRTEEGRDVEIPTATENNTTVVSDQVINEETPSRSAWNPGTAIIVLGIVCAGLLAALIWSWNGRKEKSSAAEVVPAKKERGKSEQLLLSAFSQAGDTLVLDSAVYGNTILISDTLTLQKDSLYINGNGIVMKADSSYRGPALVFGDACHHIRLNSMTFDGFNTALQANSNSVYLSGVRFINCTVPIQYNFQFPSGLYINALINDSIYAKSDSISLNQHL
jgi:serine/threonine protein phosphatase PrpC